MSSLLAVRTLATAEDTRAWGRELAELLRAGDLVILVGELGAGKTTFVQGLAQGLGVHGPVTSPTFVIARSHRPVGSGPELVHVDAYRLGGSLELDDLDLDTDVDTAVTVVEWGEGLAESLGTTGHLRVELDRALGDPDSETREGRAYGVGSRWERDARSRRERAAGAADGAASSGD